MIERICERKRYFTKSPDSSDERPEMTAGFHNFAGFPGVNSAIDGCIRRISNSIEERMQGALLIRKASPVSTAGCIFTIARFSRILFPGGTVLQMTPEFSKSLLCSKLKNDRNLAWRFIVHIHKISTLTRDVNPTVDMKSSAERTRLGKNNIMLRVSEACLILT